MSFNHPVSDLVARIKNGYLVNKDKISTPASKLRENILKILKEEGYITNYSKIQKDGFDAFDIHLKYYYEKPVVSDIKVISKPGRRIYCRSDEIPLVKNGLGTVLISTSKGILSDHEARVQKLGGEVLLSIF